MLDSRTMAFARQSLIKSPCCGHAMVWPLAVPHTFPRRDSRRSSTCVLRLGLKLIFAKFIENEASRCMLVPHNVCRSETQRLQQDQFRRDPNLWRHEEYSSTNQYRQKYRQDLSGRRITNCTIEPRPLSITMLLTSLESSIDAPGNMIWH